MLKTHRTSIIIIIFCLLSSVTYAQSGKEVAVTGDQFGQLLKAVEDAHVAIKTLSADFTQENTSSLFTDKVIQKGKLFYKWSGQLLRWEYTSPKPLTLLFNDDQVTLLTDKGPISNPNKMLNELGKMIINTINGGNITVNTNFRINYLKNSQDGSYTAILTPINKKIKANYSSIRVILNGKSYLAEKVIMTENNGDVTTITFSNIKVNTNLPEGIFIK
ncbi:MAG: outer membrane lipoprotein carrier protein LolA [Bacteroidales bacterium]|nr:outer membrane lipoprotein carrier protein LolA [Bacteroidales bacterium]